MYCTSPSKCGSPDAVAKNTRRRSSTRIAGVGGRSPLRWKGDRTSGEAFLGYGGKGDAFGRRDVDRHRRGAAAARGAHPIRGRDNHRVAHATGQQPAVLERHEVGRGDAAGGLPHRSVWLAELDGHIAVEGGVLADPVDQDQIDARAERISLQADARDRHGAPHGNLGVQQRWRRAATRKRGQAEPGRR